MLQETKSKRDGIAQFYIERPLLVEGRKFDIRVYWLIARVQPFLSLYHPDAYCRLCLNKYNADDLDDVTQHLTNQAIQKQNKED